MSTLKKVRITVEITNDEIKQLIKDAARSIAVEAEKIRDSDLDFFEDKSFEIIEKQIQSISEVKGHLDTLF